MLLYPTLLYWLAHALLAYGAEHSSHLFTEGPAWVPFTLSAALLLRAAVGRLDGRLVGAVGVIFAASILGRSTLVVLAPMFLVALLAFAPGSPRARGVIFRGIGLPLAAGLGVVFAHATIVGAWRHVGWYLGANTNIRPAMSLASAFDEPLHRLVPSRAAAAQLAVVGALYLIVLWKERWVAGRWTARPVLWVLGFGGVLVLCGFLVQVPMLPAPYYPRTIMPTYFFLLAFLPAWLDRWSRLASGTGGPSSVASGGD
jgi:hypothetical protein